MSFRTRLRRLEAVAPTAAPPRNECRPEQRRAELASILKILIERGEGVEIRDAGAAREIREIIATLKARRDRIAQKRAAVDPQTGRPEVARFLNAKAGGPEPWPGIPPEMFDD